jgi:hypothetical protein
MSGNEAYSEPFLANCCFPSILEELLMQVNCHSSEEPPLHQCLLLRPRVNTSRQRGDDAKHQPLEEATEAVLLFLMLRLWPTQEPKVGQACYRSFQ